MNRSLLEIYRFFLGQRFSIGIKAGIGILLPLLALISLNFEFVNVLAFCFGSIVLSIADQIGPMKHKRNEMACTWLGMTFIALLASHINHSPLLISLLIIFITFIGSLTCAFGKKGNSIGFALIFAALISAKPVDSPLVYSIMTSLGGLSYGIYSLIISYYLQKKNTKYSLADASFLLSQYLRALSECYRQNNQLDDSYEKLMKAQANLIEAQQDIRDLIYRQKFKEDPDYFKMANELLILIDIQERISFPFQDFREFRKAFPHSDIQIFFRDLSQKIASNLEQINMHALGGSKQLQRLGFKAELRALEYEIDLKKREKLDQSDPASFQLLRDHFYKYWHVAKQIERLRQLHLGNLNHPEKLSGQFSKFITHQLWTWSTLKNEFHTNATIMRHALRTTAAMALGLFFVSMSAFLNHGFWIAFTIVTIMSPGFSITRQKTRDRIIGTIFGCLIGGFIIQTHIPSSFMIFIIFICVVFNNGLNNSRLDLSVMFNSIYVLILSSYQYPSDDLLAFERILDTLFGAIIAIGFSYLLPSWERLALSHHKVTTRVSIQKLVESIDEVWFKKQKDSVEYRLNRRTAQQAIADITHCFQRMQREPKKQQVNLEYLSHFISRNQSILSQFMHFASELEHSPKDPSQITELYELFLIIKSIIDDQAKQSTLDKNYNPKNPLKPQEIKPLIWLIHALNRQ